MYLNNKGSILIFTLIIFSIISIVTMMCIGLNYSNKSLFKLEYQNVVLAENALSGIEIANGNILKEVEQAVSNSDSEQEFYNYFLGNNFINNIKDTSQYDLRNVFISLSNQLTYENGCISFNIVSTSSEDKYTNQVQASVKIKNPFWGMTTTDNTESKSNINNEQQINIQDIKTNINYKEIVIVYDYKEI